MVGFAKPLSKGFQGQSCETTQSWREKQVLLVCTGVCESNYIQEPGNSPFLQLVILPGAPPHPCWEVSLLSCLVEAVT